MHFYFVIFIYLAACQFVSCLVFALQVISFIACALFSGFWLCCWYRHGAARKMWPLLGWFSGFVFLGSVAGAVAWGANMQKSTLSFASLTAGVTRQQSYALAASTALWASAFLFSYGVEFICLIVPKLMLLGRLASNAIRCTRSLNTSPNCLLRTFFSARALYVIHRLLSAIVVMCGAVGLSGYTSAGIFYIQASRVSERAAAACDAQGNETPHSLELFKEANAFDTKSHTSESIENGSEAIALLLITIAFSIIVGLSVAIFRQAEIIGAKALINEVTSNNHMPVASLVQTTMQAAAHQRRRLTLACAVVLVTFPVRAAFDFMNAYVPIWFPHCRRYRDSSAATPCSTILTTSSVGRATRVNRRPTF